MGIVELLLIAVGLSMDAFAVSICRGLGMRQLNLRTAAVLALFLLTLDGLFTCRVLLITHDIDALTPRILLETMKRRTA